MLGICDGLYIYYIWLLRWLEVGTQKHFAAQHVNYQPVSLISVLLIYPDLPISPLPSQATLQSSLLSLYLQHIYIDNLIAPLRTDFLGSNTDSLYHQRDHGDFHGLSGPQSRNRRQQEASKRIQ